MATTNIRVSCPTCGELQITDDDISVICFNKNWSYAFQCPQCSRRASKWVGKTVVDLVIDIGVVPQWVSVPLELFETKSGPPLTHDDLLEFHELLETL